MYYALTWLINAFIIQLFLLSLSFPILVSWGIGFSPLIFLGNILFTPFLTIFLAVSCTIYLAELLVIPYSYMSMLLDIITAIWMKLMSYGPDFPLIACPKAPLYLLLVMPVGSWLILKKYGLKNGVKTFFLLFAWVIVVFCTIKWCFTPVFKEYNLVCGNRNVLIGLQEKSVFMIDHESVLQTRACSQAWIDYVLSSELAKQFGATTIDLIIINKATPACLVRLKTLAKKYQCKKILDSQGRIISLGI